MPQAIPLPQEDTAGAGGDPSVRRNHPEFELLRACCGLDPDRSHREVLLRALREPLHWDAVLEQASFHNVEPLVASRLLEVREQLPPEVAGELERRFRVNAQRSLLLTQELVRILARLGQRGVEAIPYKGPALAQAVYGDVALRQFSDLDILIRASDYGRAAEAVGELGYAPSSVLRPPIERAWVKTGYERGFDGPMGKNLLELQWGLAPRFYVVDVEVEDLFRRAIPGQVAAQEVRTLSPEDLWLALCVHASKHAWMRLGWICDITGVAQSQRVDFRMVRERATRLGILRIASVSLLLAKQMLECPTPAEFAGLVEEESVRQLAGRVSQVVERSTEYNAESIQYFRLMLALRERRWDRLRFVWRLLLTPGVGEWEAVALPGWLTPLYRVIRVFRVCGRLLNSGLRS